MCTYYKEYGKVPCCTHQCEGCVWFEEPEDDDNEKWPMESNMKWIWKIKLSDGRTMYCNFRNEEEMLARTESDGLRVVEYWFN